MKGAWETLTGLALWALILAGAVLGWVAAFAVAKLFWNLIVWTWGAV